MTSITQLCIVRDLQPFKVKQKFSLIVSKKQGGSEVLTQIMTFMMPHRRKRHHCSKLIAYTVKIVTNY